MAKKKAAKKAKKVPKKATKTREVVAARGRSPLPSSFKLISQVSAVFRAHWRTLLGIVLVYLVLNIIFASGLSNLGSAVNTIKADFNNSSGQPHTFAKALSGFGALVASSGSSGSSSASLLQSGLFVIESLVIIWSLRQLMAAKAVTVKEAYYQSSYPLIPFILVLLVIILQLLPVSIGALIVSAVQTSAVANSVIISVLSWLIFIALAGWSLFMLSSSIFAAYIVTLPDTRPIEALKSARSLVKYRRLALIPKIAFLPLFILAVMAVLVIPVILFASFLVAPVFYGLSMLSILFVHSYLYSLYRSLLA